MMVRTAYAVFCAVMLGIVGCSGADPGPQGGAGGGGQVVDPSLWPPSDNDSTMDDGSYWPAWKNPCPGPACDPYRADPRWLVDPPPDGVERPGTVQQNPPGGLAPQSKETTVR